MKFTFEHRYEMLGMSGNVKPCTKIELEMSVEESADMKGEFIKILSLVEEVTKRIKGVE